MELACKEQHLPEALLEVLVAWLLEHHGLDNSLIITIDGDPPALPQVAPEFGRGNRHKKFLNMDVNLGINQVRWKSPAELLLLPLIPAASSLEGGVTHHTAEDSIRDNYLNSIENWEEL